MRPTDNVLAFRINKCLNDLGNPGKHNLDLLVEELRMKYKEYGRRQKCAFKHFVNRTLSYMEEENNEGAEEIINVDEETIQKNMENNRKLKPNIDPVIDLCNDEEKGNNIEKTQSPQDLKKKRKLSGAFNEIPNSKKNKIRSYLSSIPKTSIKDFGGYREVFNNMLDFMSSQQFERSSKNSDLGTRKCILLYGPHGCGKTLLVQTLAAELGMNLIRVGGSPDVPDEASIREVFYTALKSEPCILLLDRLDELCPPIDGATEIEQKRFTQLCSSIDGLIKEADGKKVTVIGATSCLDSIDQNLRDSGRFDHLIIMNSPDRNSRYEILKILTRNKSSDGVLNDVALATPGYVAQDLKCLESIAIAAALSRMGGNLTETNGYLEICDFKKALKFYKPTSMKKGFVTESKVTWDDLGSLKDVRRTLELLCINPIKFPEEYAVYGIERPVGILLFGPPGCGKTSIAKAIASETNLNFISVKGPELFNKFLGESEAALRRCFDRARCNQPCIIFFDEIDVLCPNRSSSKEGNNVSNRLVSQMLVEMDGMKDRKGIYIIGATNLPNKLDKAIMRPGRLDKIIYVGLPSADDRVDILKTLTKVKPPMKDVDLDIIGRDESLDGFTGADLKSLVKEACNITARNHLEHGHELVVTMEIFREAAQKITPSILPQDRVVYEKIRGEYEK